MPSAAVDRARRAALVVAGILVTVVVLHLLVGWSRRSSVAQPPTVDLTLVTACLVGALALAGWARLGHLRDQVTARGRARHPERLAVLTVGDLQHRACDGLDPAWADTATRHAWRARWRLPVAPLAVALTALVLLGLATAMSRMAAGDLESRGVRTPAQVTATGWTWTGLGYSPWARVTHVEQGSTVSSTVHGLDAVAVPVGTQVEVLVDPGEPDAVMAPGIVNRPILLQWATSLLVLVAVAALAVALLRAARLLVWRSVLRATPWSPWQVDERVPGAARLTPEPAAPLTAPCPVVAATARRAGLPLGRVGLVAPHQDTILLRHRVLLGTAPGEQAGRLVELRLPPTTPARTRLVRALAPAPTGADAAPQDGPPLPAQPTPR
ncbi:hypothetical protein [Arsenicicoccus dermatophilus]|uniref:hypothetical protein n=1 Tax=Arsenicicoccus dermatophilus TaxID=1076331 RepID=UPI00391763AE